MSDPTLGDVSVAYNAVEVLRNLTPEQVDFCTPLQGPVNALATPGVTVIPYGFNPVDVLKGLGPLTAASYDVVHTLQATYSRIRHLETIAMGFRASADHWEQQAQGLAKWKNEVHTNPRGTTTTHMRVVETLDSNRHVDVPRVLAVEGEVAANEIGYITSCTPFRATYMLVTLNEQPANNSPAWLLAQAANHALEQMGRPQIATTTYGLITADDFTKEFQLALVSQEERETRLRALVGLDDTDDITLEDRLSEIASAKAAPVDDGIQDLKAALLAHDDALKVIFALVGLPGAKCPVGQLGLVDVQRVIPRIQELKTAYETAIADRDRFRNELAKHQPVEDEKHLPPLPCHEAPALPPVVEPIVAATEFPEPVEDVVEEMRCPEIGSRDAASFERAFRPDPTPSVSDIPRPEEAPVRGPGRRR